MNWPEKRTIDDGVISEVLHQALAWNACLEACKKAFDEATPAKVMTEDKDK